jgi:hypothetical protein
VIGDRGLFTIALNAGVTHPSYSFVSIRVHSWLKLESHARKNAWLTSLRRHYPHQVQRVRLNDVSAKRLPRTFFLAQNKTRIY